MTTIIHHSADYDGIFCREIARKFLPGAALIGWDFADPVLEIPDGEIIILDLPVDRPFGLDFSKTGGPELKDMLWLNRVTWIDHHKSSIETHPTTLPGYRIDGVAACRLAWQWFSLMPKKGEAEVELPEKGAFIDRRVIEPLAVRLAGEYDIWDKRDDRAETFQYGLDATATIDWHSVLAETGDGDAEAQMIVRRGDAAQRFSRKRDADMVKARSFLVKWEGLNFLALNTARCSSLTFAARDIPETGHDALMGFFWNGKKWNVSLYHARHNTHIDLSAIAVKHGGGGHRGACGFTADRLPFLP